MRRSATVTTLLAVAAVLLLPTGATGAGGTTLLRLDGIGPLKLGMTQAAAVKTGWLAHQAKGCELLSPIPVVYKTDGPKAPSGLSGSAEFTGGKLTNLAFDGGVRTATGVRIGTTTTQAVQRYTKAGYQAKAQFDETFQGTFLTVSKKKKQLLGGFGAKKTLTALAVPVVPVCE